MRSTEVENFTALISDFSKTHGLQNCPNKRRYQGTSSWIKLDRVLSRFFHLWNTKRRAIFSWQTRSRGQTGESDVVIWCLSKFGKHLSPLSRQTVNAKPFCSTGANWNHLRSISSYFHDVPCLSGLFLWGLCCWSTWKTEDWKSTHRISESFAWSMQESV